MALGGTEKVILQMAEILKPKVNKIVVCSCGGVNVEKLKQMGIRHYWIPDMESKTPQTIGTVIKTLRHILKEEKITVVHTHHRMAAFYGAMLRPFYSYVFVCSVHGMFSDKRFFTRLAYSGGNIIPCGEVVKENLRQVYHVPDLRIRVIHNAVAKEDAPACDIPLLTQLRKNGAKIVGYIGRLSPEKGVEYLVYSLPKVIARGENVRYVIVGSGPMEEKLKAQIQQYGLEAYAIFLGYREDVQNVIRHLDLVVLPSLTEGLPLTPIEAFANGKPVIATPAGGTPEIVQDQVNGILVSMRDSQALADAIVQLCQDPDMYARCCANALSTFEETFSYSKFGQELTDFYTTL